MSAQHDRRDGDWEHWPGRRPPDEGRKRRLLGLFTPTDGEEGVEALLAAKGRELEQQTEILAATIVDLEQRERKTRELRAAVEDMLRQGSTELDERHAELNDLALSLAKREEAVARAEGDISERRREAGAVELRRAAIERREAAISDREAALERISAELQARESALQGEKQRLLALDAREQTLQEREAALEHREHEVEEQSRRLDDLRRQLEAGREEIEAIRRDADTAQTGAAEQLALTADVERRRQEVEHLAAAVDERARDLEAARATVAAGRDDLRLAVARVAETLGFGAPSGEADAETAHVLFLPGDGYRLVAADGPAPAVGQTVEIEGTAYRVLRVGSSPLPGDRRRCAYLELA